MLKLEPAFDRQGQARADEVRRTYVYPFPKKPEEQAKLQRSWAIRNMLEEVAERYHTTPDTMVALNGPTG